MNIPRVAVLLLAAIAGCGARHNVPDEVVDAFLQADDLELMSLVPVTNNMDSDEKFHAYQILGSVRISDPKMRTTMVEAIDDAVANPGLRDVRCFNPRHGIRATVGAKVVDMLLCFECYKLFVIVDGEYILRTDMDESPRELFNQPLADAGIEVNASIQEWEHKVNALP